MAAATRAGGGCALVCDEEALPFGGGSLDAVLSPLYLHWCNDLPGALIQIRRALKPDGLFLASLLGGATLKELRTAFSQAEIEMEGGLSPRFSPLIDIRNLGNLLQRAGFALPVVDTETITVSYGHPLTLMHDLRGMGEANANTGRRRNFSRGTTLERAVEIYRQNHAGEGAESGRIPATFEILTMTAWAPAPNQQRPLRPGSARTPLAEALKTTEDP
jgi:SAM-dependent methyltransferase